MLKLFIFTIIFSLTMGTIFGLLLAGLTGGKAVDILFSIIFEDDEDEDDEDEDDEDEEMPEITMWTKK